MRDNGVRDLAPEYNAGSIVFLFHGELGSARFDPGFVAILIDELTHRAIDLAAFEFLPQLGDWVFDALLLIWRGSSTDQPEWATSEEKRVFQIRCFCGAGI